MSGLNPPTNPTPTLVPLGESALLVRFGNSLTDAANGAAIGLARLLDSGPPAGALEIVPNLISVLVRYDPLQTSAQTIAGEVRLRLLAHESHHAETREWSIAVAFDGPDLADVATAFGMTAEAFIAAHNQASLRVLATGFAPGFVYCGMHPNELTLPRRPTVRLSVPPGSVLFAAGQTAITATEMPTGWHVIGHTDFANFDPTASPPTRLEPGDQVRFTVAP